MPKRTPDYDNVFKTMKSKHKRLFVSVINEIFEKDYPLDVQVETLPSEGYLTESVTSDGSKIIEEQISDFLIKIQNEVYLLECQSYDDGSMAIRIAEYAFIVARQFATWDIGKAKVPMPRFSIIYVKKTERNPKKTTITFAFPNGQEVDYEADNVILEDITKEHIIKKRLFPYIPFYVARYENDMVKEGDSINAVVNDLIYFRNEMIRLHREGELDDCEIVDLMGFINTIITHITDGNENEERLVSIMGGTVIETESEKITRNATVRTVIKMGKTMGMDDKQIILKLQEVAEVSEEKAVSYLQMYGHGVVK